jgi:polysaccharide biosynthesis transport protein
MWKSSNRHFGTLDETMDPVDRRPPAPQSGSLLDLRSLWLIVRRHVRLIATVIVLVLGCAAAGFLVFPARYSATATIIVDPRQPRVSPSESVLSGIGSDAAAVESQVDLITSSALAKRVIERLDLANDSEFASVSTVQRMATGVLSLLGIHRDGDEETRINWILRRFQENLDVRRRGLTYVIEITFTSTVPAKAARIANAVAETYRDDQRSAKVDATMRASAWLNDRIAELRAKVRDSENAVADYKAANNIVDTAEGIKLIQRQVETLSQQLILARASSAEARARLERVQQISSQSGNPAALNEALQSPVIANLRVQYAEVARSEAELAAALGDHHPSLVRVRAQLADLRRQIDGEIGRILTSVRNEFEVARSRETSLEGDLAKLKDTAAKFDQADVRLRELQREVQANRALFDQFLVRAKETSEQQSMQMPDARIVAAALPPVRPNRPALGLLLVVAVAGSAVLGIGLAFIVENLDRSYRTVAQIEGDLSMPCLGIVPLPDPASARDGGALDGLLAVLSGRARPAFGGARNLIRTVVDKPSSLFAESVHAVRARVRPTGRREQGDVLAIVSAMPGEGKSVIAGNLAQASAKTGARTLLIDGDLRQASLSAAYADAKAGLVDVLQGRVALRAALLQDPRSGLSILTAGARPDTVNAIMQTDDGRLAAILRECRELFDLVIVDSPAILPVADGRRLIECSDRAVLVVEWKHTGRETVIEALNAIGGGVDKIVGVVLNKVDFAKYGLYDYGRSALYAGGAKAVYAKRGPEAIAAE